MIASPLNYTGGKYRLLPQLLPLFPRDIRIFADLFCGGCNVGLNTEAEQVLYNDADRHLVDLFTTFRTLDRNTALDWIDGIIARYGLSDVSTHGYAHYRCDGATGLAAYNREPYLRLRRDFNQRVREGRTDDYSNILFYVLIVYAFNNQIRFNSQGEYNLPVGKRDFNAQMRRKLTGFIDRLQSQNCRFTCRDFRSFDTSGLGPRDLVYADPPYLITCATYNEQGGWCEEDERDLLDLLDGLHRRQIRFALSNVLRSKGRENRILLRWLAERPDYQAVPLDFDYSNSNYHTKDRDSGSEEVLIVSYPPPVP